MCKRFWIKYGGVAFWLTAFKKLWCCILNRIEFIVYDSQVDEGIEAMLCCWLQQLQEFGGPEVDKPDLLKGSIGSLKNLGVVNVSAATSTTTSTAPAVTTSNIKAPTVSTAGSIIKNNPCLDKRARYNVSIQFYIKRNIQITMEHQRQQKHPSFSFVCTSIDARFTFCCSFFCKKKKSLFAEIRFFISVNSHN